MLFFLIAMRMAGFVFLNPVFGRRNIPNMVKSGMAMALTLVVYMAETSRGTPEDLEIDQTLMYGVLLLKEFAVGYLLGFTMQLFDMVMTFAGTVTDFQLGLSMAMVYDPQNGGQVALTGNIFQTFFLLLFFAVDGHLALMKILLTSAEVVPYSEVAFTKEAAWMMMDIFSQCIVLAVKMSFPLIAFEFLIQVGVGVMTKVNPQINLFVMSIQLRLAIGLVLLVFLVSPIMDFMGNVVAEMMDTLQQVLKAVAG